MFIESYCSLIALIPMNKSHIISAGDINLLSNLLVEVLRSTYINIKQYCRTEKAVRMKLVFTLPIYHKILSRLIEVWKK